MNIEREDIHIVVRHSNLTEERIAHALQEKVYTDQTAWCKFLRLLFISLGVGFSVAGIVFFFAYNWGNLNKFTKIGLMESLLIVTTILVLLPKMNSTIRNVILSGASVLVGVLFAVFGQIYQTGANAYDFFLAWTIFVTLWVLVSDFAPLWLLYLVLINITIILYSEQVAYWSAIFVYTVLFVINAIVAISPVFFPAKKIPTWFVNIVTLGAITCATIGISHIIFDKFRPTSLVLILLTALTYALGIWHGLKTKSGFYLSVVLFSLIIISSVFLVEKLGKYDETLLGVLSLFIITSVTFTIKFIINTQKK